MQQEFYAAVKSGDLERVKAMHKEGMLLDSKACSLARFATRLEVVEYAYLEGACDDWDHIEPSVQEWILANGYHLWGEWDRRAVSLAAMAGRVDVVKFLHGAVMGCKKTLATLGDVAEEAGHRKAMEAYTPDVIRVTYPREIINWVRENEGGRVWGGWAAGAFARAAMAGRVEVVSFLYECGCTIDADIETRNWEISEFLTGANIPHKAITLPMPACKCHTPCTAECERWELYHLQWINQSGAMGATDMGCGVDLDDY